MSSLVLLIIGMLLCSCCADMWIRVNVKKIQRKPCIVDESSWGAQSTGCAAMTYMTLDERMMPSHERRSTSFEHIDGVLRPTVTHWPRGDLRDWMLSIQFISVDPLYGITRTCDLSGFVNIFKNDPSTLSAFDHGGFVEKSVTIEGQCFIAHVDVQSSKNICPWCIEETEIVTTTTTNAPELMQNVPRMTMVMMICLTAITIIALLATGITLVFYLFEKRQTVTATLPVYQLPSPVSTSSLSAKTRKLSQSTWTTTSSSDWIEYPTERWTSYRIQNTTPTNSDSDLSEYQDIQKICPTPDSGMESV